MAEVLKLAQFGERDTVAEVQIRGGGIDSEFNAEWFAGGEFFREFFFADEMHGATADDFEGFSDGFHEGWRVD